MYNVREDCSLNSLSILHDSVRNETPSNKFLTPSNKFQIKGGTYGAGRAAKWLWMLSTPIFSLICYIVMITLEIIIPCKIDCHKRNTHSVSVITLLSRSNDLGLCFLFLLTCSSAIGCSLNHFKASFKCGVVRKPWALLGFRRKDGDCLCFFYCFHNIADVNYLIKHFPSLSTLWERLTGMEISINLESALLAVQKSKESSCWGS